MTVTKGKGIDFTTALRTSHCCGCSPPRAKTVAYTDDAWAMWWRRACVQERGREEAKQQQSARARREEAGEEISGRASRKRGKSPVEKDAPGKSTWHVHTKRVKSTHLVGVQVGLHRMRGGADAGQLRREFPRHLDQLLGQCPVPPHTPESRQCRAQSNARRRCDQTHKFLDAAGDSGMAKRKERERLSNQAVTVYVN